jgi:hypothetical protein
MDEAAGERFAPDGAVMKDLLFEVPPHVIDLVGSWWVRVHGLGHFRKL